MIIDSGLRFWATLYIYLFAVFRMHILSAQFK